MTELKARTTETTTMLASENQQEVAAVIDFLNELNQEEKKDFFTFIKGIRYAKEFKQKAAMQMG